jgi:alpha/beta superfamily hydrolase
MTAEAVPATLLTGDGVSLEARWDLPAGNGVAAVVLCHPHPRYGGNMEVPLLRTVAASLTAAGCAVLRFNFRGVGASTGAWGGGEAEIGDVAAAAATAGTTFPDLPLGVAGWSFGAATALAWQADTAGSAPYVGIAPPTRPDIGTGLPDPARLPPARRLFVLGDRDQFTTVADLSAYAAALGADVLVIPGSDHFLYGREHRVGEAVAAHMARAAGG